MPTIRERLKAIQKERGIKPGETSAPERREKAPSKAQKRRTPSAPALDTEEELAALLSEAEGQSLVLPYDPDPKSITAKLYREAFRRGFQVRATVLRIRSGEAPEEATRYHVFGREKAEELMSEEMAREGTKLTIDIDILEPEEA